MGAISMLGFIVWAQIDVMGLLLREWQVINSCYMLGRLYATNYINTAFLTIQYCVTMFVGYTFCISVAFCDIIQGVSDQSTGNCLPWGTLQGDSLIIRAFGYARTSETIRNISVKAVAYPGGPFGAVTRGYTAGQEASTKGDWFMDWFVGFAEGDGSFSCDRTAKRLYFQLRQKDPKLLYIIKSYFGFGSIVQDKVGYYSWTVSGKKDILTLINLFNGKLVLSKTNHRFVNEWLVNYNLWFALDNPIAYKGIGSFVGLKNAWLCGLTDADGSLGFMIAKDKTRKHGCRVRIYWYVDQSGLTTHEDLEKMRTVLGFGFIDKKRYNPDSKSFAPSVPGAAYRLITMSATDCKQLQVYFTKYTPLTTIKKVRLIRWNRVLNWCLERVWFEHLSAIQHLIQLNSRL